MPKNFYDQYDTKCTKCRQEVYSGGGQQFVDDEGRLQRYCQKCYKKYWQEIERKYDAAAAKSAESAPPADSGPVTMPESTKVPAPPADRQPQSNQQLPTPPSDGVGTQGDGASGGAVV